MLFTLDSMINLDNVYIMHKDYLTLQTRDPDKLYKLLQEWYLVQYWMFTPDVQSKIKKYVLAL